MAMVRIPRFLVQTAKAGQQRAFALNQLFLILVPLCDEIVIFIWQTYGLLHITGLPRIVVSLQTQFCLKPLQICWGFFLSMP